MIPFEPELYREQICLGWDDVAEDYQVITTPFLAQYLPRFIESAELKSNMMVLDVGTGTGLAAFEVADIIKPQGRVLAVDYSEQMLHIIRTEIDEKNITNVDIYKMAAEELDIDSNMFDRVICSFGLSFFQEPMKALSEMYRVLKEDGKLTLSTWATQDKCLVLGLMDTILKSNIPALKKNGSPSIFQFGTEEMLKEALEKTGFKDINIISEIHTARYAKAEDYWDKLYRTGPELRRILSKLSKEEVSKIKATVCSEVEKYRDGDKIILPSEALIATGTK